MNKLKHYITEIRKNWKNRNWWKDRFIYYVIGNYYKKKPNRGIYVMEEDWDNLIILDACRYDTFVEVTKTDAEYRISRGSSTPNFLRKNFINHKFRDTVYVTANPWVDKLCNKSFYDILSVWRYEWNEELGTVHPESVVEYGLRAEEKYPDKRLIIHFLQPHWWYLSDPELAKMVANKQPTGEIIGSPWGLVEKGLLELDRVYSAYKSDLKIVYRYSLELVKKLNGKTIITADHGEAFGEKVFGIFSFLGHTDNLYIPPLIKVPWLVFNSAERKEIKISDEKQRLKNRIRKMKKKSKL